MSFQKKFQKKISLRSKRRANRVKNKQVDRGIKPRVCVFRSLNHISAQIIDDAAGRTLCSFSSLSLKDKKKDKKVVVAKNVGMLLGKIAQDNSVTEVFFDRGKYLYHGRVRALAEGLREAGLKF